MESYTDEQKKQIVERFREVFAISEGGLTSLFLEQLQYKWEDTAYVFMEHIMETISEEKYKQLRIQQYDSKLKHERDEWQNRFIELRNLIRSACQLITEARTWGYSGSEASWEDVLGFDPGADYLGLRE